MTQRPLQPAALLDAYVDGLMNEEERAAFERAMAEDFDLRAEVQRQRAIDDAIARILPVPPQERLRGVVTTAREHHAGHRRRRNPAPGRWLAIAASVLLCVSGGWLVWRVARPGPRPGGAYVDQPRRSMDRVYADALAAGFEPEVVCEDDAAFESWFRQQLRRPLRLRPLPDGVEALGLGYSHTLSPATIYLLAKADGARIIVFIDRLDRHTDWRPADGSGLHLHRAERGDLVLYELSPLPVPRLLDHLYDPGGETGS